MEPIRVVIRPVLEDAALRWSVRSPGHEAKYATRRDAIRAARGDANRRLTDGRDSELLVLGDDGAVDHVEHFTRITQGRMSAADYAHAHARVA